MRFPAPGPIAMNEPQVIRHMLSFDVEEYFQCEVFRDVIGPDRWSHWPSRIDGQMDRLLAQLGRSEVRATFFVLGSLARSHPRIVRNIAAAGHEIACHGDSHEMLGRLGPTQFAAETADAKALLEDIAGQAVIGYRAATFSVNHATAWAIDALAEMGFAYDSSVQPVRHDRYGVPDAPARPHWAIGPRGSRVLEIPPMTMSLAGRELPLGGGGFFRLLPRVLFDRELRRRGRQQHPAMLYLHPWEFDPAQPKVPVGRASNFRHRVNLARTAGKLNTLLARHDFAPVRELLAGLAVEAGPLTHRYAA